jgi:hypothetical protein
MLLVGSLLAFLNRKTGPALLEVLGTTGLALVGLAHVAEVGGIISWIGWGLPISTGHYVDLSGAVDESNTVSNRLFLALAYRMTVEQAEAGWERAMNKIAACGSDQFRYAAIRGMSINLFQIDVAYGKGAVDISRSGSNSRNAVGERRVEQCVLACRGT